jgi:hypothetical protein
MKYLIAMIAAAVTTSAPAAPVNITVAPPTQNVDSSAIPVSGPGSIASYRVEYGTCSGGAFGVRAGELTLTGVSGTVDLGPGSYCFRAFARNTFGVESAASNVVARTVVAPTPQPPTIVTVAVVAGINMAPLYRINLDGTRGSTVLGFVPVGATCIGDPVYTYRGRTYRRVDTAVAQWWNTAPTANAAAPCA